MWSTGRNRPVSESCRLITAVYELSSSCAVCRDMQSFVDDDDEEIINNHKFVNNQRLNVQKHYHHQSSVFYMDASLSVNNG